MLGLLILGIIAVGVSLLPHWKTLYLWVRLSPAFTLARLKNDAGRPEFRHVRSGITMVLVPKGSGMEPFLIAKFEVSQAEWQRVMQTNPSSFPGERLPVETLSYFDAEAFCKEVGLKVPTEAQWEYAARAGTTTPYAFGEVLLPAQAHFGHDDPGATPVAVDSLAPNGWGLHHVHGNVQEWCADVEIVKRLAQSVADGPRVIRGGNWRSHERHCRSSSRTLADPRHDFLIVGLRPVYSPLPMSF